MAKKEVKTERNVELKLQNNTKRLRIKEKIFYISCLQELFAKTKQ